MTFFISWRKKECSQFLNVDKNEQRTQFIENSSKLLIFLPHQTKMIIIISSQPSHSETAITAMTWLTKDKIAWIMTAGSLYRVSCPNTITTLQMRLIMLNGNKLCFQFSLPAKCEHFQDAKLMCVWLWKRCKSEENTRNISRENDDHDDDDNDNDYGCIDAVRRGPNGI